MQYLSLSGTMIAVIVAVAVIVVVILAIVMWYISSKNGLVSLRNDMEEAYSAMDVQMKKRYDLVPNLVETCKGYAKFEGDTLTRVTQARNIALSASGAEKAAAEKEFGQALQMLMNFVSEQYPDLKANSQFNNLSRQLEQIEDEIARSRKFYNAKVKIINNKIEKFPSSIVASKMKLERYPFFEIDDISQRNAPKVSFDDSPRVRL